MQNERLGGFSLLNYNVRQTSTVLISLFEDERILMYDLILIQEPAINDFGQAATITAGGYAANFWPIFRSDVGKECRTVTYINKRIHVAKWSETAVTRHVVGLRVTKDGQTLDIYNVYDLGDKIDEFAEEIDGETVHPTAAEWVAGVAMENIPPGQLLIAGDFNAHHSDFNNDASDSERGVRLIQAMATHGLYQILPKNTVTRRAERSDHRDSTLDLVWADEFLQEMVLEIKVSDQHDNFSDHYPIEVIFEWETLAPEEEEERRKVWRKIDERILRDELDAGLQGRFTDIYGYMKTPMVLDTVSRELVEIIRSSLDSATPTLRINHTRSIPGFTPELKEFQMEVRHLWKDLRAGRVPWEQRPAIKEKSNELHRRIKRLKRDNWREHVKEASESRKITDLWRLVKVVRTDRAAPTPRLPELKAGGVSATTPGEKAKMLQGQFFPPPVTADLDDIEGSVYPEAFQWASFTEWELQYAVRRSKNGKAPGPDCIVNEALKLVLPRVKNIVMWIFNTSFEIGYFPAVFRESTTIVLRKPGKESYKTPKAYRPIALLNTLGKTLESMVANRLAYVVENHAVLPATHLGGRKMLSCELAVHQIVTRVHQAWEEKKCASVLSLDVSGAFDNVSHDRLLHNLRKRGLGGPWARWIASFLKDRKTYLQLPEYRTEQIDVAVGIPQGSPVSPVLYTFYNADLMDDVARLDMEVIGWIDDMNVIAVGRSFTETAHMLNQVLRRCDNWSRTHGSQFAPDKFQLVHFLPRWTRIKPADITRAVRYRDEIIKPKGWAKILGVTLDQQLTFRSHIAKVNAKVKGHLGAIRRLGASTWGVEAADVRDIYRATVLPTYLNCSSAWLTTREAEKELESAQYDAAKFITGVYKGVAKVELEAETGLLPIGVRVREEAERALIRMAAIPQGRKLIRSVKRGTRSKAPLAMLIRQFEEEHGRDALEIDKRLGFIVPPWANSLNIITNIEPTKEQACAVHDVLVRQEGIHIYTDGSGIDGLVGAACYCLETAGQAQSFLGSSSAATVYTGELQGLILALEYMQTLDRITPVYIFTDNQAVVWTSNNPNAAIAQRYLRRLHELLEQTLCPVQIHWVPGHEGIPGNEIVDILAKTATGWRPRGQPRGQPANTPSYAETNQHWFRAQIKLATKIRWAKRYNEARTGRKYKRIFRKIEEVNPADLKHLPKGVTSLITQMRTDKLALRGYLFRRHVPGIEDPLCYECPEEVRVLPGRITIPAREIQDVHHVLYDCQAFQDQRRDLQGRLTGTGARGIRNLIGGDIRNALAAALFMVSTGLLPNVERVAQDIERALDSLSSRASSQVEQTGTDQVGVVTTPEEFGRSIAEHRTSLTGSQWGETQQGVSLTLGEPLNLDH
jgi:ribonuclease HI